MKKTRHFRTLLDINKNEFLSIIKRAVELKNAQKNGEYNNTLNKKVLAMIFKKNSTRTRISLEASMNKLGGHAIFLSSDSSQLSRGESLADTAKVLSGMVDLIAIRTHDHNDVIELSSNSSIPVINALTSKFHPCQLLADMQTLYEEKGEISGRRIAWVGDGCNMCNSYINASKILGFHLKISTPHGFEPDNETLENATETSELCDLPGNAVEGCDLVTTDVWSSMGEEHEHDKRKHLFKGYQINQNLIDKAKDDVIFLHCLPAHRGEEVSTEVIDGPSSRVWQQAHNRLYSTQALIEFLLNN